MKKTKNKKINPKILADLQELTTARLLSISKDVKIAVGDGDYSQAEIISHVEKADDIGQEFMEMQLEFLQDLAEGKIYQYE